jgi:uncharacterized protein
MTMGLVLDLSRLGEGTTTLTERMDIGEFEVSWPGLRFRRELEVTVVVVRSGHDLDITIRFAGERQGDCDRCLKPYEHPFTGELRALGRKGGAAHPLAGQDGVVFHDGRHLDLTGELRQAVLIDIPIRTLCMEECRGLCPICGADRNLVPCDCAVEAIDPRWDVLRRARRS